MREQLIRAIRLLEIALDDMSPKDEEPTIVDDINEFLDDYYAEVSLLNENFNKAIEGAMDNYDIIATIVTPMSDNPKTEETKVYIVNSKSGRKYEASYYYNDNELQIINKFKEVE
jgi:hypothetical protein